MAQFYPPSDQIPMGHFCSVILRDLSKKVLLNPDPTITTANNDLVRWIWVDHEQAYCQLYRNAVVAVKCDCNACAHDEDKEPATEGHDGECGCIDCVCPARKLTGKYDQDFVLDAPPTYTESA